MSISRIDVIDVVVHFLLYEDQGHGRNTGRANSFFLCICICVYEIGGCVCCVQR